MGSRKRGTRIREVRCTHEHDFPTRSRRGAGISMRGSPTACSFVDTRMRDFSCSRQHIA